MRNIEIELQNRLSSHWRRIWICRSRLNTICITLFPITFSSDYRIITKQNITDLSIDNLVKLIEEGL